MQNLRNEQGQSVVLIALGLAVLMGFMALAVDGGNVYAQRRQVQNAVDAASSAAGERLARPDPTSNGRATNGQVLDIVKKYLRQNGVDPDGATANLSVKYITQDSAKTMHTDGAQITSYGSNLAAPLKIPPGTGDPVVGVSVTVDKPFNSFFAGIVGIRTMQVGAASPGYGAPIFNNPTPESPTTGACCSDELFPIAINQQMFQDLNGDGNLDVLFEESSPTTDFPIFQRNTTPNFYYVHWKNDSNSATDLVSNMNDLTRSDTWYVQEWMPASAGTMSNGSVYNALKARKDACKAVTVPVFDSAPNDKSKFRIVGFARLQITGVCYITGTNNSGTKSGTCTVSNANEPYIMGHFEQWTSSRCEGSCAFFGVRTNKPAPPVPQERALIGVVKLPVHTLKNISFTQTPVDVVHVLDISGSMKDCIGSPNSSCANNNTNQKLNLAKNALITFNSIVSPTLGDRIGLATFPSTQSTSSYSMPCGGSYNILMYGRNGSNGSNGNLTANIGTPVAPYNPTSSMNYIINNLDANSGTPLAGGLSVGRGMVLDGNYHVANHQPVLVVASDGIANVRTNGKWSGFQGSTYSAPTCNADAVADAVAEANVAKQDANHDGRPDVIIFTIAIGTDFNADALKAISSAPTDSHFFTASSRTEMQNIYNQIATVLQTGDCAASDREDFAGGANLVIRNKTTGQTYNVTTTSAGYFEIRGVDPGTFEIQSASVTVNGLVYDLFTDGVGGPVLADKPTVEVLDAPQSYAVNLALDTDDFSGSCH